MKQVWTCIRFLLALTALCAAATFAQAPPTELEGAFSSSNHLVELRWHEPNAETQPLSYRVFRNGNGDSSFTLIGTAADRALDDSTIAPGAHYGYYVTALYTGNIESLPSNTVSVFTGSTSDSTDDGNNATLAFVSTPGKVATINEPYAYAPVMATQPTGLSVCFELHDAPSGMTMDPATGALSWTPGNVGMFEVELRARICSGDGEAEQRYTIMVLAGPPGEISGHVTDTLGAPIRHVRIKIFDATNGAFILRTRTDSTGLYDFPMVNAGTYFIHAEADSDRFQDEWFNGVTRLSDATGVTVAEGGSATADFILRAKNDSVRSHITISGTVRDSSGAPLAGARVTAFHSRHHDDGNDEIFNDDHQHDGGGDDDDRSAQTDSLGEYHITVRSGSFIVRAKAEGFFEQFWDGKNTLLEADLLTIAGDTAGIDFSLHAGHHPTTGTGVISGTIRAAADSTSLRSYVLGLQKNFTGQFTGFVTSTHSDSSGNYSLDGLPSGFYVVLAKHEDEFIPTFYTPSGGTVFLDSAAILFVDNSTVSGADIYLAADTADGLNEIEGHVESDNSLPGKTAPIVPMSAAPLPGTIVVVTTAGGAVAGSTITDNTGAYIIPGLAAGTYTTTFQRPGSTTLQVGTTLTYTNNVPATSSVNAILTAQPPVQTGLMSVHANWNLVSVPVTAADLQTSALFPGATSPAFAFAGGYQASTVLSYGAGYWVKFGANQVLTLPGAERLAQTVPLAKGWNLIGSLSYPVAAASLQASPAGIIATDYFSYGGGYASATVIEPGRGYWVKASAAGLLTMQVSAGSSPSSSAPHVAPADAVSLTISDADGNAQTLSFVTDGSGTVRELPPPPPAGAFDVRFASGNMAEVLPADLRAVRAFPLALQLQSRTITVAWSAAAAAAHLRLVNERGITVATSGKASSTITLAQASHLSVVAEPSAVPKEFALEQNYPNPFNPSTSIQFALPAAGRASLRVYNLIGQEVSVLLDNQELEAGAHSVTFDASQLASGVYLYRLDAARSDNPAARFSEVRKMVLVK